MIDSFFVQLAFKFNIPPDICTLDRCYFSICTTNTLHGFCDSAMNLLKHRCDCCPSVALEVKKKKKPEGFAEHWGIATVVDSGKNFNGYLETILVLGYND